MPNLKFSQFDTETTTTSVTGIVGYNTTANKNIQITPANFVTSAGTGVFLPLAGGTMTGNIVFNSGVRAQFGGGNSEIFFTGSNFVASTFAGDFIISNYADDKDIIFQSDDGNGGVTPYFYLDGGGVVTRFEQKLRMQDSVRFQAGSSGDFSIRHNGVDSYLENETGNLYIKQNESDGDIIFQSDDGSGGEATYFEIDGSATNMKVYKDMRFTDNVDAEFGDGGDFKIYHDSNNTYLEQINAGTGNIIISNANDDGDIIFNSDNGSGGTATYVTIDGTNVRTKFSKNTIHTDSIKANFGSGSDLSIYHDGINSYIDDTSGQGSLYVNTNAFRLVSANKTENMFSAFENAQVQLYYNNSVKLATTTEGVDVTGKLNVVPTSGNGELSIQRASGAQILLQAQASAGVVGVQTNDRLDFKTNGATRMSISNTGDVGIGTTSPGRELEVQGSGNVFIKVAASTDDDSSAIELENTQNTWTIKNDDTEGDSLKFQSGGSTKVTMLSSGDVGVGTTSPGRLLTLSGSTSPYLSLVSNTTGGSPAIFFGDTDDDNEGRITYSNASDYMALFTAATERIRINSSGNVGIGTTVPVSKLEVDGGDIEIDDSASGLILRSPDGTRYRVTVANGGAISASAV